MRRLTSRRVSWTCKNLCGICSSVNFPTVETVEFNWIFVAFGVLEECGFRGKQRMYLKILFLDRSLARTMSCSRCAKIFGVLQFRVQRLPDREFEVLVPTVPLKIKLKDGSISDSRRKIFQGIVLLRCVMDWDVYDLVRRIPRAYDFFDNLAGVRIEAERRRAAEKEIQEAEALLLEVGVTIRVKALVTVFGKDTPIVLDVEQVDVAAATPK